MLTVARQALVRQHGRQELGVAGRDDGRIGERARDPGRQVLRLQRVHDRVLAGDHVGPRLLVLDDVLHQLDRLALHRRLEAVANAIRQVRVVDDVSSARVVGRIQAHVVAEHGDAAGQEPGISGLVEEAVEGRAAHEAADRRAQHRGTAVHHRLRLGSGRVTAGEQHGGLAQNGLVGGELHAVPELTGDRSIARTRGAGLLHRRHEFSQGLVLHRLRVHEGRAATVVHPADDLGEQRVARAAGVIAQHVVVLQFGATRHEYQGRTRGHLAGRVAGRAGVLHRGPDKAAERRRYLGAGAAIIDAYRDRVAIEVARRVGHRQRDGVLTRLHERVLSGLAGLDRAVVLEVPLIVGDAALGLHRHERDGQRRRTICIGHCHRLRRDGISKLTLRCPRAGRVGRPTPAARGQCHCCDYD